MKIIILLSLLIYLPLSYSDEFSELEQESSTSTSFGPQKIEWSAFLEFEQGLNTTGAGIQRQGSNKTDYVLATRKFRLQASKNTDRGSAIAKLDFVMDDITNEEKVELRELFFKYRVSDNLDLSLGRQVTTWGVGDMLFINDLFPKNWVALFTGRDQELLKNTANSIRTTAYLGKQTFDLVITPKHSPDTTPDGCRFGIYDPNTQTRISNKTACTSSNNSLNHKVDGGEFALSISRLIAEYQLTFYGYHGFYKSPKGIKISNGNFVGYYPRLNVYGASLEGQLGPGIFTLETGFYDSLEDQKGDNHLIENSAFKYLLGYNMDITSRLSFGTQFYHEIMQEYESYQNALQNNNPSAHPYRKQKNQKTYTLRLTYKMQQETLRLSLFSYIRPDDKDSYTKLELSKKIDDNLSFTFGANIFTGKDHYLDREFGMLKDDDNIYTRVRYLF